jgi:hypothetical protein
VKIVGPIPAIAISFVRMLPTPATIAFGGVPTFERTKKKAQKMFKFELMFNSPACGKQSNSSKQPGTSATLDVFQWPKPFQPKLAG